MDKRESFTGKEVQEQDFSSCQELVKDFYVEQESVKNRDPAEVEKYRTEHHMRLVGKDIPNPVMTFEEAGFPANITRVLQSKYSEPTPIQAQGWPMALSGRDMVGVARTGTGKTVGYTLPALVHIQAQPALRRGDGPITLVLAPTRELVTQIKEECDLFAKSIRVRTAAVYGGASKFKQIRELDYGLSLLCHLSCIYSNGFLIRLRNRRCHPRPFDRLDR
jgi:superfamily II DNA/RNA helicase